MGFRTISDDQVLRMLQAWRNGDGLRSIAAREGLDRKTVRRYVEAGQSLGLTRSTQPEDGNAGPTPPAEAVTALTRRGRCRGPAWEELEGHRDRIRHWTTEQGLALTQVRERLAASGVDVPYRTLHRFAVLRCGYQGRRGGRHGLDPSGPTPPRRDPDVAATRIAAVS